MNNILEMQYREGCGGDQLSVLGYGCMRFSQKGNGIDYEKAETELLKAIELGVNYFDTAYIYSGSEAALGEIFGRNHCRDKIYLATKLPQYLVRSAGAIDKYFNTQRKRLKTDHIDYYLIHMLNDVATWQRLEKLGIKEWIDKKKASGEIRHIGFSFHGNTEMFLKLLDIYQWDFCQIQYNYMDEFSQAGREGLIAASKKGLPVIVMEPLRGGSLVTQLPHEASELIEGHEPHRSPAEWALRWLWDQPEVTCVLSGMNSLEMLHENVEVGATAMPNALTSEDLNFIQEIKEKIGAGVKVGCTGCGYCKPCPQGVDIIGSFRCYNLEGLEGKRKAVKEYIKITAAQKKPGSASLCNECGRCETHCPQNIPIRKELKNVKRELETPFYKLSKIAFRMINRW